MSLYLDLMDRIIRDQVYPTVATPVDQMPIRAYTALSKDSLRNVRDCCDKAITEGVPGAFVECGVWRGGAIAMMAAVTKWHSEEVKDFGGTNQQRRLVFGCDSFEGLPPPSTPQDAGLNLFIYQALSVSEEQVHRNLVSLGLNGYVQTLKGWFKDTLPQLAQNLKDLGLPIAVLRADGDLYESTRNIMDNLYPLLSPSGFFIEDDYFNIPQARMAVDDYRKEHRIYTEILRADNYTGFWRKE